MQPPTAVIWRKQNGYVSCNQRFLLTNVIILKSFNLWYWLTNACREATKRWENAMENGNKQTGGNKYL